MADDLKIEVLQRGDGDLAEIGQRVTVHFEGRLTNDKMFDASRPRDQPVSFTIGSGQVIKGWEQGIAGMRVGEVRRLTIVPEMAYGETGAAGIIPPDATLVFDVELLDVTAPVFLGQATPGDLLKAQKNGAAVIDIRRPEEWSQTGIIEGAETITAFETNGCFNGDFHEKLMALVSSPKKPVLLYCQIGVRSQHLGTTLLEKLGFTEVSHLRDGIVGWTKDGYKTIGYNLNVLNSL